MTKNVATTAMTSSSIQTNHKPDFTCSPSPSNPSKTIITKPAQRDRKDSAAGRQKGIARFPRRESLTPNAKVPKPSNTVMTNHANKISLGLDGKPLSHLTVGSDTQRT